jgi:hypothetical protein
MARGLHGGKPKGGKKNRKWANNKEYCERYRREGRQEINRERRILRHLKKYPNDKQAEKALLE